LLSDNIRRDFVVSPLQDSGVSLARQLARREKFIKLGGEQRADNCDPVTGEVNVQQAAMSGGGTTASIKKAAGRDFPQHCGVVSGRWDSNPRHLPWQGSILPLNYTRIFFRV
jgi:hypothetical protein